MIIFSGINQRDRPTTHKNAIAQSLTQKRDRPIPSLKNAIARSAI
ncbi:MAG: hypothetical protein ACKO7R_20255 [Pseudanabaena sp.]